MGTPDTINAFFIESADYKRYGISITRYPNPYEGDSYSVKFNSNYTYYQYKNSFVAFDKNEKLIYFVNKGNLNLNFGAKDQSSTGIRVDSTEEDIVKAMGTPKAVLNEMWGYDSCWISFDQTTNKLVAYTNTTGLNMEKVQPDPAAMFGYGSYQDEVIKAMGLPDKIYIQEASAVSVYDIYSAWWYGGSKINFNNEGKVLNWFNNEGNLKIQN